MPSNITPTCLWDSQLSDREVYFIGTISVHWGAMEHEIFLQTLFTFDADASNAVQLPKEMNNIQFTGVLALWEERVVAKARGKRAKTLRCQYEQILALKSARDALIHGMWHWSPEDLGVIKTTRVKKREVITMQFSVADLKDFACKVAEINFHLRFPSGFSDLTRARIREGGYVSRKAAAMFAGAPVDKQGFPVGNSGDKKSSP